MDFIKNSQFLNHSTYFRLAFYYKSGDIILGYVNFLPTQNSMTFKEQIYYHQPIGNFFAFIAIFIVMQTIGPPSFGHNRNENVTRIRSLDYLNGTCYVDKLISPHKRIKNSTPISAPRHANPQAC